MAKTMTEGKPFKLLLQFAAPLLIGNILQQTYNIIDAAIVGRILGANALASVGATSSGDLYRLWRSRSQMLWCKAPGPDERLYFQRPGADSCGGSDTDDALRPALSLDLTYSFGAGGALLECASVSSGDLSGTALYLFI